MKSIVANLGEKAGWVVDVRANEGGWDLVSLEYASTFASERRLVWSKRERAGSEHDEFTEWEDHYVKKSRENAYDGPVVVLTSGGTFSAGETFVLAMRELDNVTILGEVTSGHHSDLHDTKLPNGWALDFSGEQYRAADGEVYEAVGIPPDVVSMLDVDALMAGRVHQIAKRADVADIKTQVTDANQSLATQEAKSTVED
jgi:C-terminal processing protease CtpA/Prc